VDVADVGDRIGDAHCDRVGEWRIDRDDRRHEHHPAPAFPGQVLRRVAARTPAHAHYNVAFREHVRERVQRFPVHIGDHMHVSGFPRGLFLKHLPGQVHAHGKDRAR